MAGTVTAQFRFYGELNVFVAPGRRQRTFACACAPDATVKHMVEALGVPHTEVGLLLVNGAPAPFERLLREGDRVAVYPRFASIDIGSMAPARAPLPAWRFVADAHLGGLARLLRMAGFDTLYDNGFADDRIESLAIDEERLVLTRDRELLKRRAVEHGCYVHALRPQAQLAEVAGRLNLGAAAAPFTLCLHCNAPLRAVAKAVILDRLPPAVRTHQHDFRTCDVCLRVYWKGSHWRRMAALLEAALEGRPPLS
ncbi:MAG: Twitching motility protein PilT [Massilia sp.]|jgi:uncharacterized protein with PIN domain|nr:Twitching motility protein PilT [Massilia sp.]